MKARKFGYDVAYARPSVHTSCKRMPDVRLFLRESVWLPASFEEETTKESGTCQKLAGRRGVETEGGPQLFEIQKTEGS